ncbi:MAG: hypothetical protein U0821_12925 [Chloroflexota bacterium]
MGEIATRVNHDARDKAKDVYPAGVHRARHQHRTFAGEPRRACIRGLLQHPGTPADLSAGQAHAAEQRATG